MKQTIGCKNLTTVIQSHGVIIKACIKSPECLNQYQSI